MRGVLLAVVVLSVATVSCGFGNYPDIRVIEQNGLVRDLHDGGVAYMDYILIDRNGNYCFFPTSETHPSANWDYNIELKRKNGTVIVSRARLSWMSYTKIIAARVDGNYCDKGDMVKAVWE